MRREYMYSLTPEESEKQSNYSPSPVHCDEELLRTMIHPDHVLNGEVTVAAVALSDLKSRGFSVDRVNYATRERIQRAIDKNLSKNPELIEKGQDPRTGCDIAKFQCRSVREVVDADQQRAFVVIDDGIEINDAHAKILSAAKRGDGALRKLRDLLTPFLQDRKEIHEIDFPLDRAASG